MALLTVFLIGVGVVIAFIALYAFMDKKRYKYPCMIAIPTGNSPDDVVFVNDRFMLKKVKGRDEVRFFRESGKAYNPDHKFFTKFFSNKKSLPEGEGAVIDDPDLRKHLLRGAFFYKASPEEYKVMKINTDGNFTVLDTNTKEMIIDDIERQQEITTSFKNKLLQLGLWLGSLLIIGLLAVVIIVLTFQYAGETTTTMTGALKNICSQATQQVVGA